MKEIKGNWLDLLHHLQDTFDQIEIFSTNYDLIVEETFRHFKANGGKNFTIHDGRQISGCANIIDQSPWVSRPSLAAISNESKKPYVRLSKLHGSIDWILRPDGDIGYGNPVFTGDLNKHIFIAPGFKGCPDNNLLLRKHELFQQALSQAKVVLFIGFAFRDEYLNTLIEKQPNLGAKTIIIDPQEDLLHLPEELKKAKHLKKNFDSPAISQAETAIKLLLGQKP